METLAAHPHPADSFAGMEVRGDLLTDKENAGAALLDACKEVKNAKPVQVGSYRGYAMSVSFDAFEPGIYAPAERQMTHQGHSRYRPSRAKSCPYRQCPRADAAASGGGKGPAG